MIEYTVKVSKAGDKSWCLNGKLHREDGPAMEYSNGDKSWYTNGKLHRLDGPAVEWDGGINFWYLNDKRITEEQHKIATAPKSSCSGKEVVIDGITYVRKEKNND